MTFAMVIAQKPASGNADPNRGFTQAIQTEAHRRMGSAPLLTGDLYIRINWFYNVTNGPDVDNIIKRIADSLKTVVYADDSVVRQCLARAIDLQGDYTLSKDHIAPELALLLQSLINSGSPHILYIEVGAIPSTIIPFGPIDGGAE